MSQSVIISWGAHVPSQLVDGSCGHNWLTKTRGVLADGHILNSKVGTVKCIIVASGHWSCPQQTQLGSTTFHNQEYWLLLSEINSQPDLHHCCPIIAVMSLLSCNCCHIVAIKWLLLCSWIFMQLSLCHCTSHHVIIVAPMPLHHDWCQWIPIGICNHATWQAHCFLFMKAYTSSV